MPLAREALPPEVALARLREGNRRFVAGEGSVLRSWHPGLIEGQWPFAVVLGCSDSRAPAEYVFDQGLGDLFVIRVAGNIVAPSLVGSVEFAAERFGTRLVVVMGHTQCGAVAATVQALEGDAHDSHNVRSIVDRITPHVERLFRGPDDRLEGRKCRRAPCTPADHDARLAEAVRVNAIASAADLRGSSPLLRDLATRGRVVIVASVYDLATGVVSFLELPSPIDPSLRSGVRLEP